MTDEVLNLFMRYSWPGNVRELEHAIEHAFVLCHDETITSDHIPSEVSEFSEIPNLSSQKNLSKSNHDLLQALEKTRWNKTEAARLLGVSRQTLYRRIKKNRLTDPS